MNSNRVTFYPMRPSRHSSTDSPPWLAPV